MTIKIYYCSMWNYLPQASRLEEELKNNFKDIDINLIAGSGGTFKVIVDEKVIFDKLAISKTESVFPQTNQISKLINEEFSFGN